MTGSNVQSNVGDLDHLVRVRRRELERVYADMDIHTGAAGGNLNKRRMSGSSESNQGAGPLGTFLLVSVVVLIVVIAATDGKKFRENLFPSSSDQTMPALKDIGDIGDIGRSFKQFQQIVEALNKDVKKEAGIDFFTRVRNLGDGIVEVTATDAWLSGPEDGKLSNLKTLFQLWDLADGTGSPIAVYIVDGSGEPMMSKSRP